MDSPGRRTGRPRVGPRGRQVDEDQDDDTERAGEGRRVRRPSRSRPLRRIRVRNRYDKPGAGTGRTTPAPSARHPWRPSPGARVSSRSRRCQARLTATPSGQTLDNATRLEEQRRSRDGRRPVRPSSHPLAQGRTPGPCERHGRTCARDLRSPSAPPLDARATVSGRKDPTLRSVPQSLAARL